MRGEAVRNRKHVGTVTWTNSGQFSNNGHSQVQHATDTGLEHSHENGKIIGLQILMLSLAWKAATEVEPTWFDFGDWKWSQRWAQKCTCIFINSFCSWWADFKTVPDFYLE